MYLFYTPQIVGTADEIGKTYSLDEEESGHCVRVLRYTRGDEILLTNGQGMTYTAVITNPHPKHCEFEVHTAEKQSKHHSNYIHIAIAPTKNVERIEWFVEKCTEIGVDEITPLMTDCTEFIRHTEEETRFIAHCYKEDKRDLRNEIKPGKSVVVMIGPEGDFSEQEIAEALQHNFVPVSLGDSRLRTETAGIVACHICNLFSN